MTIALEINGKTISVNAPPDTPLLWVLRDELQMTGTKYGCGIAQCGACTVHIDGQATRSCQAPISSLTGVKDIDDAMSGNICRCGTYQRIRAAIKDAAGLSG
jgi:isoquinoline 1-oxidoreductase alpha subunit